MKKKLNYFSQLKSGGNLPKPNITDLNVFSAVKEDVHTLYSSRGTGNVRVLLIPDAKTRTKGAVLMLLHQMLEV